MVLVGCSFGTVERNTSTPATSARKMRRTTSLGITGAFAEAERRCIALPVTDLAKRLDRPVVLVGQMGVGKSTVGRRLARRLGLPFIDSDSAIEDASGFSAAEVFERFGESDFCDGERRLVARLIEDEHEIRVIATGGSAYVDSTTRKLLNERTITVWLDAPVDVLAERTARRNTRPLLRTPDPKGTLERLSEERRPSYQEAHIHVRSGDGAHRDVVEAIVQALENHLTNGEA
jgi:shikimate kinase